MGKRGEKITPAPPFGFPETPFGFPTGGMSHADARCAKGTSLHVAAGNRMLAYPHPTGGEWHSPRNIDGHKGEGRNGLYRIHIKAAPPIFPVVVIDPSDDIAMLSLSESIHQLLTKGPRTVDYDILSVVSFIKGRVVILWKPASRAH